MTRSGHQILVDRESGEQGINTHKPYIVQYEFFLELVRQVLFEEETSRFQSYFGLRSWRMRRISVQRIERGINKLLR